MSVIGFVFACVPGALIVGWVLLPIAFNLGIVGLFLAGKAKGTSIAAVIVSIIGTAVCVVVFLTVVSDAFKDAFHKPDLSASSPTPSSGSKDDDKPGNRGNPFPIGQTVTNQEWEITLGAPKSGMEYWIAPVTSHLHRRGQRKYGVQYLDQVRRFR